VPAGWLEDPKAFAEELGGRLAALASGLGEVDAHAVTGERRERFLSTRANLARGTIAEGATPITVDDGSIVIRRPDSICELVVKPDRLVVLLGDRRLEMPVRLEQAMRQIARLGADASLVVRDLALHLPDAASRAVLVRRLVREGVLTIVHER
jgi:hypothetical protein